MGSEVSVPKRQVFKATEVCSIAGVQPYILKSWEVEFPTLAQPKKKGVYRRTDVEMVLRIKTLVFGKGLTLGAARRSLEAETEATSAVGEGSVLAGLVDTEIRERITGVRQGLREILSLLSANGDAASGPVATFAEADQFDTPPVLGAKTARAARQRKQPR